MEHMHLTSFERKGVQWQVGLRRISRDLSPTGLALVFATAPAPHVASPILWPVGTSLLEDLLDSIGSSGANRLAQELEAALKWHGAADDSDPSTELGARRPMTSQAG